METSLNHECIICGTNYHHCDSCNRMRTFTPWRIICDTAEHYQIYMIIMNYQLNNITKEEAKEQLGIVGVTANDIEIFKDSAKGVLKEILADDIQENVVISDEVANTKKSKIKE